MLSRSKLKKLLAMFLVAAMMAGVLPMAAIADEWGQQAYVDGGYDPDGNPDYGPVSEQDDITIYITFEGYNLGHGFYAGPAAMTVPAGSTAADVTFGLLDQMDIEYSAFTDRNYLSSVNFGSFDVELPPYLTHLEPYLSDVLRPGWIGEFDYSPTSGWMYTVNHVLSDLGIAEKTIYDGDVIRWQFTVLGLGADLGFLGEWGEDQVYAHADKTYLIRSLFSPEAITSAKEAARSVVINPLATEIEVAMAAGALSGVDREALLVLIGEAELLIAGDYSASTWNIFASALAAARTVAGDWAAPQAQIDAAALALDAAMSGLAESGDFDGTVIAGISAGGLGAAAADFLAHYGGATTMDITSLTLTGYMNDADVQWIAANCPNVVTLDLGGAEMSGAIGAAAASRWGGTSDVATNANYPKLMELKHIVMPKQGEPYALPASFFEKLTNLETADVSNARAFGNNIFQDCTGLTHILTPKISFTVGDNAFRNCSGLAGIDASMASSFGTAAFYGCESLTDEGLVMPAAFTLTTQMFMNCYSLTSFDLRYANLGSATHVFEGSNVASVTTPERRWSIPANFFVRNRALETIDLSQVDSLGAYAFYGCTGLREVTTPSDRTFTVANGAFWDCESLAYIDFSYARHASQVGSPSVNVFQNAGLVRITMPNTEFAVGDSMFINCRNLEFLDLSRVNNIRGNAFSGTISLGAVLMPDIVPTFTGSPFNGISSGMLLLVSDDSIYRANNQTRNLNIVRHGIGGPEEAIGTGGSLLLFAYPGYILPDTYEFQWYKDGEAIPGENSSVYVRDNISQDDSGAYSFSLFGADTGVSLDVIVEEGAPPQGVDKTDLGALIDEAEGLSPAGFGEGSWGAMLFAAQEAKAVYENAGVNQLVVNEALGNLRAAIANLLPLANAIWLRAPEGSQIGVYQKGMHFAPFKGFKIYRNESRSALAANYDVYEADLPRAMDIHVEVSLPGHVKIARRINIASGANETARTFTFDLTPVSAWPTQNDSRDNQNIYTSLDDSGTLNLDVGGSPVNLDYMRVWQAVDTVTANYFIEPDYEIEVVGGDSVDIKQVGAPGRRMLEITPVKQGVSVIKLAYGPLQYTYSGSAQHRFNPILPANTGLVVVNVGGGAPFDAGIGARNDFDTYYFDRGKTDHYDYAFKPPAGAAVRAHDPIHDRAWGSAWTPYAAGADGSFTVSLKEGRNIIEVTYNGSAQYHVVKALGVGVSVENRTRAGEPLAVGDTARITITGLQMPIEKLAGVYNPGFGSGLGAIAYESPDGTIRSSAGISQFDVSRGVIEYTVATDEAKLTGGAISMGAMGDPIGSHRAIPAAGRAANFNAVLHGPYLFGGLPDISLLEQVIPPDEPIPVYKDALDNVLSRVRSVTPDPDFSVIGGEWAVLALARAGVADSAWYDKYLDNLDKYVKSANTFSVNQATGKVVLHRVRYTDNSRVILALTALGLDASDWNGYDFVSALYDKQANGQYQAAWQGINGPIWALMAIDTGNYATPALRADLIQLILNGQFTDGSWGLAGSDFDLTAMAIQALAPYYDGNPSAKAAADRGLAWLRARNIPDAEGVAQMIVALSALGLDAADYYGKDYIASLLAYRDTATGGFLRGGAVNAMATEQAAYSLVAYDRCLKNANRLYDMGDAGGGSVIVPVITITTQPQNASFTVGNISGSLTVAATVAPNAALGYQWYGNTVNSASGGTPVSGAAGAGFTIPASLAQGIYYYYAVVTSPGAAQVATNVAVVTVSSGTGGGGEGNNNGGGGGNPVTARASISVTDPNAKAGQTPVFFSLREFTLNPGETAYSLLLRTGLNIRATGNAAYGGMYVEAINGFGEFDDGPQSGWMYRVGGVFPDYSSSMYTLKNGDTVEWLYTRSLGLDIGGDGATGTNPGIGNTGTGTPGTGTPGGGSGPDTSGPDASGTGQVGDGSTGSQGGQSGSSGGTITIGDLTIPLAAFDNWVNPFADVNENDWYYDSVRFVNVPGLMQGTGEGVFSPDTNLSRAMVVTILWRLEGEPAGDNGGVFGDVAAGQWYTGSIEWANANGIVAGYGNGLFGPDDDVTREQLAVIMRNYAGFKGIDTDAEAYAGEFSDADSVSEWARGAMMWANAQGLILGRTQSALAPDGTATRAEAAAILTRFIVNILNA